MVKKIILLIFLFVSFHSFSQDTIEVKKVRKFKNNFEAGLIIGGQIANENFIYNSGAIIHYSLNMQVSNMFQIGVGCSFQKLDTESIIPVFANFKIDLSKRRRTWFFSSDIGYTFCWNDYFRNFPEYEYWGGFYFSPGVAYRVPFLKRLAFTVFMGLIHQASWVEYTPIGGDVYKEKITFDMASFRIGLQF